MNFIDKVQIRILKSRKRRACARLKDFSNKYENLENFHYYVNMNPTTYYFEKKKLEEKIFSLHTKVEKLNVKIKSLKQKP